MDQCQQVVGRSRWRGVCRDGGYDSNPPSPRYNGCCPADSNTDTWLEGDANGDAVSPCCARLVPNCYGHARIRTHHDLYGAARYTNAYGFPYAFPLSFTFALTFTIPHCDTEPNIDANASACCRITPSTAARAWSGGEGKRSGHVRMGR
jgi:hypothetical protein